MISLCERITAAFTGKNIGGTLGMPYEGSETRLELTFYEPVPREPVPNDDLDLQLVWLRAFEEHGAALDAPTLAGYWSRYINVHWDEYGVALCNLRHGVLPPLSGVHNNNFRDGMGAAIRSEIWAALFPGRPESAAWFAWQDAQVDHGGDGIYGEVYWAALESLLFGGVELQQAMTRALAYLPETSRLKAAFLFIDGEIAEGQDPMALLDRLERDYYSVNFTDVVMNCAIAYWALRCGEGDFEKSILMAVNAGQDADCTGATVGACIGAAYGMAAIPERWQSAIGDAVRPGDYLKLEALPASIGELVGRICRLQSETAERDAPALSALPLILPEVEDFSERRVFRVNGRRVEFPGIRLEAAFFGVVPGDQVRLSATVEAPADGDANLMVASRGLFTVRIDGALRAVKGDQARPVPAVHRVRGGRIIPLQVRRGQKVRLEIEVFPTAPVPDVYVGFFDWNNAHVDMKFED